MLIKLLTTVYRAGHKAGWTEAELIFKQTAWETEKNQMTEDFNREKMEYFTLGQNHPEEIMLDDLVDDLEEI